MARPREFDRDKAVLKAMELFWKQGYEATSVQDLGACLGLHPGSLYNTFTDKHSLFLEALDRYEQVESERVCDLLLAPTAGKAAIQELFQRTLDAVSNDPDHKGCFMVNSAAELAAHDPDVRSKVVASRQRLEQALLHAIERGQQCGEITLQHDRGALATFLINAIFGLRVTAKVEANRKALQQIVDITLRVLD